MHVIPLPMYIAADAVAGEIIFGVGCAGGRAWDCVELNVERKERKYPTIASSSA